jgi:hypothetical protein
MNMYEYVATLIVLLVSKCLNTVSLNVDVLPCEGKPIVPSSFPKELFTSYEMVNAQVLTRHGARTTVFTLPGNGSNDDVDWMCTFGHFDACDASPRRAFRKTYQKDVEILKGNCAEGQLTTTGSHMHMNLGNVYRERYVERLNLTFPDSVRVRATDVPRVFASVQSNLAAMFPNTITTTGEIYTIDNAADPLANPNQICALGMKIGKDRLEDETSKAYLESRRDEMTRILNKFNLSFDVENFNLWQAASIPDQVYARKCSMNDSPLSLPNGATYEDARFIFDTTAYLSYHELNTTQMRRFSAGLLVKEMMSNIDNTIAGVEDNRFFFFSAHDTTVYPLLNAFGAWSEDETWPPFASHVELELWRTRDSENNNRENYAVSLTYNGRVMSFFNECNSPCPLVKLDGLLEKIIPESRVAYDEECVLSGNDDEKTLHSLQLARRRLNSA